MKWTSSFVHQTCACAYLKPKTTTEGSDTGVGISYAYSQKSVEISWESDNELPCARCFSAPYSSVHYSKLQGRPNFLTINASYCEIIVFAKSTISTHAAEAHNLPVKEEAKCLGYTCGKGIYPHCAKIFKKARKAFFSTWHHPCLPG